MLRKSLKNDGQSILLMDMDKVGDKIARAKKDITDLANNAYGPDKYTIRSYIPQVEIMGELIRSTNRVSRSVKRFEKSTKTTEKHMLWLTIAGICVAVSQLVLALVTISLPDKSENAAVNIPTPTQVTPTAVISSTTTTLEPIMKSSVNLEEKAVSD